jgi:hypothetical protein
MRVVRRCWFASDTGCDETAVAAVLRLQQNPTILPLRDRNAGLDGRRPEVHTHAH